MRVEFPPLPDELSTSTQRKKLGTEPQLHHKVGDRRVPNIEETSAVGLRDGTGILQQKIHKHEIQIHPPTPTLEIGFFYLHSTFTPMNLKFSIDLCGREKEKRP